MIVLAYLWVLCLVPLLVEKEDREVQWHAKHGLVLFLGELILWAAIFMLSTLMSVVTVGFGCLLTLLSPLISVGLLVLHILCIVKGVNGQRLIIPGISQFAERF